MLKRQRAAFISKVPDLPMQQLGIAADDCPQLASVIPVLRQWGLDVA